MFPLHEGHGHEGTVGGLGPEAMLVASVGVLVVVVAAGYLFTTYVGDSRDETDHS